MVVMRKLRALGVLGVLLFGGSVGVRGAAADSALSLREAVERALRQNPVALAAAAGREAAAAQSSEAKAGRLPSLQFSETFINGNNPVYVFGSLLEQGRFGPGNFELDALNHPGSFSNFRSSLNLRIPVFNRFQVASGIDRARIAEDQAEAGSDWVRQQIRLQVVRTYFGLLLAEERREVASETVRAAERDVENIRAKVEEGVAVTSDLLAMEVQLAEFRQELVQAEGDERTALAALNTVLALPVDTPHRLAEGLEDRRFQVGEQSQLVEAALTNRPDYRNAEREVEAVETRIRAARGQQWPDLNLFAEVGHSGRHWAEGSGDYAVGARLNFDILDFARPARVRQAVAVSEGVRAERERIGSRIRFEVVEAYQAYLSSRERLRLASAAVTQAEEVLRIVQDRHDVGLTTVTEVLRAQTALLRARFSVLGARYDHYVSYGRILLSTGTLDDVSAFAG
jgi:outer membrane protein